MSISGIQCMVYGMMHPATMKQLLFARKLLKLLKMVTGVNGQPGVPAVRPVGRAPSLPGRGNVIHPPLLMAENPVLVDTLKKGFATLYLAILQYLGTETASEILHTHIDSFQKM